MTSIEKKIDGMEREKLEIAYNGPYCMKLMNAPPEKPRFTQEELKGMGKETNGMFNDISRKFKSPRDHLAEGIVYSSLIGTALGLGLILYDFFR